MAIKKDSVGNDRLTFRAQAFQPGGCDCDTPGYEDEVGNDKVVDLSCTDKVKVLRTIPMHLTPEEQKIVKKNLSISDISKAYVAANGHLMLVLTDGTETDAGEARGIPGDTPYVGDNGNWFIAGKDTGVLATGIAVMPRIGENGNWYLGNVDTGVLATGKNGDMPHIGENGNWFIGDVDSGVKATGEAGITPHIGENGNWFIGDVDTGVKATSEDVSLYADDLYTSGVLVTDDLESFVMTGKTSDTGTPQLITSPGVVYIKGIRRRFAKSTRTFHVPDKEHVSVQYIRLNEITGEIEQQNWEDVIIDGDIHNGGTITGIETGILPRRSGGYYDVILCIVTLPAGATEVTPDMITDLRGDEQYCGFVRSKVDSSAKALNEHNVSETAHGDIRLLLAGLSERLNAIADSDDTTLDQLSEIVAYIKSNKTLIESVTTSKVNVADIIDNLTTSVSDQPLSAKMGVELRRLISVVENSAYNAMSKASAALDQASSAESVASSAMNRASSAEQMASAAESKASDALRAANAAQPAGDYIKKDDLSGVVEDAVSDAVGDLVGEAVEDLVGGSLKDIVTDIVEDVISGEKDAFSETGEVVELAVEEGTPLSVISKIHRDSTWDLSDKLVLHQVSGSNFVDFSAYFGGAGTVITKSGLTATVNADSTVTITGTNELDGWNYVLDKDFWSGVQSEKVYPAGTYTLPSGFILVVRAAKHPSNVNITGATGNLSRTVTIPEAFRIVQIRYAVKANMTVDLTLPFGLFRGEAVPETEFAYNGHLHTVTFDRQVYEGEFNWTTGELKDADGNTVAYYDSPDIVSLPGSNYFWTGFGENTVSNVPKNLEKVVIRLNETAPEETVPSICDFVLTPTTPEAGYGLYYSPFLPNGGKFYGSEVPVLTTKGTLSVKDADGNIKYSKYVEPIFNTRGVADVLTHKGLEKKWSGKFYLNKEPVSITHVPPPYNGAIDNYVFVWEFDESEFVNTGIPAKIHDIPMASPCFINNDKSENNVNTELLWNGTPYPAFFTYNEDTGKYALTARGIRGDSIKSQLTVYSKVHFYYKLETPYNSPFAFAMGVESGDQIIFKADLADNQPYIDALNNFKNKSVEPSVSVFVPRNVEDAMDGMTNAARMLNMDETDGGDATVQGYSWIGAGDGSTDYTVQIQSKIDELRTISNGGTIHLGPGTYPISKSLIVYGNTQIIGDGHTVIEQRSDNTHAVIWNGSNIRMRDLTIKLAGACTEITACIFANSNNAPNGIRDERYPENMYVQYCSTSNVTLVGTYGLAWEGGYQYLPDEMLDYRGVGIYGKMYFNFCDSNNLICKHLYSGVHDGGGSNNYRLFVTDSRFAVYGGGGYNIFDINGHTLYGYGSDGNRILATDYVYYGTKSDGNTITIDFYDAQFAKGVVYFDTHCHRNHYTMFALDSGLGSGNYPVELWGHVFTRVTDYGRSNNEVQPYRERFVGIGPCVSTITQLPYWNTQFNPSIHNALSGAGVWGDITSNKAWTSRGINLSEVCRYPKETLTTGFGLAYIKSESSPSEESPVEIIIDISNRPVATYKGFWIQFAPDYVAEDYKISFDTTNDGVFDYIANEMIGNIEPVAYNFNYQVPTRMVYRIKISITKALQIPELKYSDAEYKEYTVNYNPDGLVGIVNIGIPSNEAYGRAFLGECGGSLYGNVDMHQNTLRNLPAPVEDGDAVSKAYLEQRLAELEALIGKG